ncbi:MAG: DUF58 domain-containing protein [Planctomycetaceae bacterium]|nr:DUF58 domain-containing protein [Planctomycetaceae bacterium]MBT6484164.1 DUF58 domain-containing protein [Planctomycetaceae bacterium]
MPVGRSNRNGGDRSVSMGGLLAFLVGFGLLLAYWLFSDLTKNFSQWERWAFVGTTSFLSLWGLKQMTEARRPSARRRRLSRKDFPLANGRNESTSAWSISWIGILLVFAGLVLLLTIRLQVPPGIPATLVAIGGCLCLVFGVRRILATVLPRRYGNKPQYRVALPKSGASYLLVMTVLLVGSLLGHSNMLMLVFAMMVGPFVLNGWITFSMLRRTELSRRIPKTVIAGESFTVDIRLKNRKLLLASTVMMVTDQIENELEQLDCQVLFARVPARSSRTDSYRVCLMQRGLYRFGPLHLATRFPLGIVERRLIFPAFDILLIYPRIGQLTDAWRRGRSMAAEVIDQRTPARGAFHDEFHGMREYRPGDNPRSIHWRTSVRRNELTVREYQQNRSQDLMILIDLWKPENPTEADRERIELAVSFAATLAVDHMRNARDARLDVAVAGRELERWEGRSGPAGIDSLLEMLALADSRMNPDVAALSTDAEMRRSSSTRVLLLTTRPLSSDVLDAIRESTDNGDAPPSQGHFEIMPVGLRELAPYFTFDAAGSNAGMKYSDGDGVSAVQSAPER